VPEALLHDLRMHARSEEQRGVGVAEIVEPDSRQVRRLHPTLERVGEQLRV
jgi:hypothetical protein